MIARARVAAFEILRAVSSGRADLPSAIAHARESLDDDRDRALAAEIATGVLRHRSALDYLIATFAKRDLDRLDPEIVAVLRLSSYQLLHLTRVPAAAVVDDAVDLTRRVKKRSAAGFVNAVLRTLSRNRGDLPLPARPHDAHDREAAIRYLAITLSHPRWLAERWHDRLGLARAERWMQFNNEPAKLTLRVNRLKTTPDALVARLDRDDVFVTRGRWAPDALIVTQGRALQSDAAGDGWFVVQDEASQLVALLAGRSPGPRVLDACASPGGKTTAMAASMHGRGLVVACDVRDARIALLVRTIAASGAANVRVVQADLERPLPFSQTFDCVLVDAPCSGLGTLRRDPDIRWRRQESDLPVLAAAQQSMIRNAAASVAAGGRLIYATCSSEPEENEHVVEAFLAAEPSFVALDAREIADVPSATIDAHRRLRTTPDEHGLECFFGAVLERRKL
ncbi:MAG TPA: 16S rRNA (cytosine(967)-C(5))-methyltransferase RsmB [Vicinamibacterales bacterium]|nr:16S rRNA (cytosine(967)-C(5))-methyltransferase RsmB [Vicinamibacterales bacterium]